MSHDGNEFQKVLSSLVKKPAWGLQRTYGSMFFLEIGIPLSRPNGKKLHGEWHFLVEMCHWRIQSQEAVIVGSEDDPILIDETFSRLDLGVVEKVSALAPSHDLSLLFSSGLTLMTFTTSASATDHWTQWQVFCPDDDVWIVDGGGHLLRQKADEVPT